MCLNDICCDKAAARLKNQRREGMGPSSSNHYLRALKNFGGWLMRSRQHPENPFAFVAYVNAQTDARRERRCLTDEELVRIIEAAENGKPFRLTCGEDRVMIYLSAANTGLRANEIASLTTASCDRTSEPKTVTIETGDSKHRTNDVLPLHPDLAMRLFDWLTTP